MRLKALSTYLLLLSLFLLELQLAFGQRQFYSPRYGDPKVPEPVMVLRKTIFWEPYILTDKNGFAEVSFFTAQKAGTYKIVIEGIDENGNVVRSVMRKEVK